MQLGNGSICASNQKRSIVVFANLQVARDAPQRIAAKSWVQGEINYTDDFSDERYTKFKYVQADPLGNGYFALEFAADGNEAK